MIVSLFWDTAIIYHATLLFSVLFFAALAFLYGIYVYGKTGFQLASYTLDYGTRRSAKGKKAITKKYRRFFAVLRATAIAFQKTIRAYIDRVKKEVFIDE